MDPADDDNLNIEKQTEITRKMFLGGFFFLPWLWLINALYYREYIAKPGKEVPFLIKKCKFYVFLLSSLFSFFLLFVLFFLLFYNEWIVNGNGFDSKIK